MRLAQKFDGEIICADSQTIRRGLNIGTAKPLAADRKLIPHHLLDIIGPYARFTVAEFQRLANKAIEDISERAKLPILVGGTGLYIDSVLFAYNFENKTADKNPRAGTLILGIDIDKEVLAGRIANRIDSILEQGFIDEVRGVIKKYGYPPTSFDAIGYKIVMSCMDSNGEVDQEAVRSSMNTADRQYAKRQKTWFKRNNDIVWVQSSEQAQNIVSNFLRKFDTIDK